MSKVYTPTPKVMCAKVVKVDLDATNPLGGIGVMEVWANMEQVDRYRELTLATAFESSIQRFKSTGKWPPFLATHMMTWADGDVPILGRLFDAEVIEGKGVKAWLAFAPDSVQPLARRWLNAYAGGWITDVSVGFISKSYSFPEVKVDTDPYMVHEDVDWYELSGGAVGAELGSEAIAVTVSKSLDTAPADVRSLVEGLRAIDACFRTVSAITRGKATDEESDDDGPTIDEDDNEFRVAMPVDGDTDADTKRTLKLVDAEEKAVCGDVVNLKTEDDTTGNVVLTSICFRKEDGWKDADGVKDFLKDADLPELLSKAVDAEGGSDDDEEDDDAEERMMKDATQKLLDAAERLDARCKELKEQSDKFDRGLAAINKMHEGQVTLAARLAVAIDNSAKTMKSVPAVSRGAQGAAAVTPEEQATLEGIAKSLREMDEASRGSSVNAVRDTRESREE